MGQQIPVDDRFLEEHLQKLYDAAYRQDAKIRSLVQELVPEYVTGNERNNIIAYAPEKRRGRNIRGEGTLQREAKQEEYANE